MSEELPPFPKSDPDSLRTATGSERSVEDLFALNTKKLRDLGVLTKHYPDTLLLARPREEALFGALVELKRLRKENESLRKENQFLDRDRSIPRSSTLLVSSTEAGLAVTFPEGLDAGELVESLRAIIGAKEGKV